MAFQSKETAPQTGQIILAVKKKYVFIPDGQGGTQDVSSNVPVAHIYWDNGWFDEDDGEPMTREWTHWDLLMRETKMKSKRLRK
jgi:hypothetical protein